MPKSEMTQPSATGQAPMDAAAVERWRESLSMQYVNRNRVDALCDLALKGLSARSETAMPQVMRDHRDRIVQLEDALLSIGDFANGQSDVGNIIAKRCREALGAVPSATRQIKDAEAAIDLFLEYRDKHGHDEDAAKTAALNEFAEAASVEVDNGK